MTYQYKAMAYMHFIVSSAVSRGDGLIQNYLSIVLAVILSFYLAHLFKLLYRDIVVLCSAVFGLAIIL